MSKYEKTMAVFGAGMSVAFSLIGWKADSLPTGLMLGSLVLGVAGLGAIAILVILQHIDDLRRIDTALTSGVILRSPSEKRKALTSTMEHSSRVTGLTTSRFLSELPAALAMPTALRDRLTNSLPTQLDGLTAARDMTLISPPYPIPVLILSETSDSRVSVILAGPDAALDPWLQVTEPNFVGSLRKHLESTPWPPVSPKNHAAPEWLGDQAERLLTRYRADWTELVRGRVRARSRSDVSDTQLAVSAKVTSTIDALDISDIEVWMPGQRCGVLLDLNIELAKSGVRIRRVFILSSPEALTTSPTLLAKVKDVLTRHTKHNLAVGVAFESHLPDELVRDIAIYDARVAWIETTRGTLNAGGGYFTTNTDDLKEQTEVFEKVWNWPVPKPHSVAQSIVDGQVLTIGNLA